MCYERTILRNLRHSCIKWYKDYKLVLLIAIADNLIYEYSVFNGLFGLKSIISRNTIFHIILNIGTTLRDSPFTQVVQGSFLQRYWFKLHLLVSYDYCHNTLILFIHAFVSHFRMNSINWCILNSTAYTVCYKKFELLFTFINYWYYICSRARSDTMELIT